MTMPERIWANVQRLRTWMEGGHCGGTEYIRADALNEARDEMRRYLPIIEAAERDPALWERLTAETGVATANGYRAALARIGG